MILVTRNVDDFKSIIGLELFNPWDWQAKKPHVVCKPRTAVY
jgi:hypothetical protein